MTDVSVYPLASAVLEQLVAQLEATRAGPICVDMIHPGDMVPAYTCGECDSGEGIAWVRVVSITPTRNFPQPQASWIHDDTIVQASVVLELGCDRCYWTPADNSPPTRAQLDSMARDAQDDAAAMLRAIRCTPGLTAIPGIWTPRGPSGGTHGGTMLATVLAGGWCPCDVTPTPLDDIVSQLPDDPRVTG